MILKKQIIKAQATYELNLKLLFEYEDHLDRLKSIEKDSSADRSIISFIVLKIADLKKVVRESDRIVNSLKLREIKFKTKQVNKEADPLEPSIEPAICQCKSMANHDIFMNECKACDLPIYISKQMIA